ncbi:MAG: hypothetical protein VW496_00430 [Pelagibacteraceae bacterium]
MKNTQFKNALVITKRQEKALENAKANNFSSILRLARVLDHIKGDKKSVSQKMLEEYGLQFIDRRRRADAKKFLELLQSDRQVWGLYRSGRFSSVPSLLNEYRKLNKPAKGETSQGETSEGDSTPELSEALPETMNAKEIAAYVAVICEKYEIKPADVFRELLGKKELVKLTLAA